MVLYYWNISFGKKNASVSAQKSSKNWEYGGNGVQHSKNHFFQSSYALFLESFRTVQKRQSKHFFKGALEVLEAEMLKELFEKVFRQMIHGVHKLYWNSLLATDAAAAYSKASELKLRTMLLLLLLTSWQAYCKKPGTISQSIDGMNFGEICHVLTILQF